MKVWSWGCPGSLRSGDVEAACYREVGMELQCGPTNLLSQLFFLNSKPSMCQLVGGAVLLSAAGSAVSGWGVQRL